MTRRFPETFLTLLGCLLLLAALATAAGAVPLKAAPPSGCAGRVCQVDDDWEFSDCTGNCNQTTACQVFDGSVTQSGNTYCGCSPDFEPACCYVRLDPTGKPEDAGDCPNCSAPGVCGLHDLPNGCKVARCR